MIGESSLSQYYNAQPHNTLPPLGRIKPEPIIDYFDENGKRFLSALTADFRTSCIWPAGPSWNACI
jgi:hypothetical protein